MYKIPVCLVTVAVFFLSVLPARGQFLLPGQAGVADTPRATVQASVDSQSLQAGQRGSMAVVLDLKSGFHAQSHQPLDENLIALKVAMDAQPGIQYGEPVYPPGEIHQYPALGKLSVYTGKVTIRVPFQVAMDTKPGPVKLAGKMNYQICDDQSCYPPDQASFSAEATIIPGISADASKPAVAEANKPVTAGRSGASVADVSFLGLKLQLGQDSFIQAMLIAFLVGIIFNVMPCVLPVLPLKAISFYEVAQHSRSRSLLLSGVFGLGIVAAFAVLAVFVLVLRTFAWGELFATPWFIWSIVAILVVMAFGMFGAFAISLPTAVYSITPRHDTYMGNFLFGILTAILATPCTAPMFPGLLLWATAQTAVVGVMAMLTVGLGMAFPYVILSAFPEIARRFPRTGPFAELVKQMLGFLLLGAAAFFAGGRLIGGQAFWWIVLAVVVWAALFLVIRTTQLTSGSTALLVVTALAVSMVGGSLWFVLHMNGLIGSQGGSSLAGATATVEANGVAWQAYSPEALETARKANRIVLVKFTANWCSNCQYVEATVFHDARTVEAMKKHDVVPLKADLTLQSAAGWPLLKQLSSTGGIPLTAIYAPGDAEPVKIASIYTTQTLLDTLDRLASAQRPAVALR